MKRLPFALLVCASLAVASPLLAQVPDSTASGDSSSSAGTPHAATADVKFGAAATVNPYATDAAMQTLRDGGNAIDAACATMLTLGVVNGHNSGIGGGCFMLIRLADGRVVALDGREMAPAKATKDMFIRDGHGDTKLSQNGPLASGVPGSLAVYDFATKHFGKKTLAELLLPAAKLADDGFRMDGNYAGRITALHDEIMKYDGTRAILFPNGEPIRTGQTMVQHDLANTYRAIAREGIGYFYGGQFAKQVEAWMASHGGILTAEDFAKYEVVQRQPIETEYRGHKIIGFPPPSSGGLHVAQILSMLDRFDLAHMSEPDRLTTIANAMDLAFADRAFWLGDPDFAKVPHGLIDANYLKEQSAKVLSDGPLVNPQHGTPPNADADTFHRMEMKHTTHVSIADAMGNVVSITATVNTSFGSKVVVPGTGVFLNDQMDDFSIEPGVPNAFGLVGAEANSVAPGKRPLSSMSPTIVLNADGKPNVVIGAAGGPTIITQVVCVLSNLLDLHEDPAVAMIAPRIHHQWQPHVLKIEVTAPLLEREELQRRGFTLVETPVSGATNMIWIDGTKMTAVSEPRLRSKAAAE